MHGAWLQLSHLLTQFRFFLDTLIGMGVKIWQSPWEFRACRCSSKCSCCGVLVASSQIYSSLHQCTRAREPLSMRFDLLEISSEVICGFVHPPALLAAGLEYFHREGYLCWRRARTPCNNARAHCADLSAGHLLPVHSTLLRPWQVSALSCM